MTKDISEENFENPFVFPSDFANYEFSEVFVCSEPHWRLLIKALEHLEATGYRSTDPLIREAAASRLELSEVKKFLKDFYLLL